MARSRGTVRLHLLAVEAAEKQAGVVSRRQLLGLGWTSEEIQGQVRARRWTRLHRGVYSTVNGPPSRAASLWAAVLACGDGAVLHVATAAEAWGFGPVQGVVHVAVPRATSPRRRLAGVRVRRVTALAERSDVSAGPPRTTVEDTVLDLVEQSSSDRAAMGWVSRALQAGRTTPDLLLEASRLRHRMVRRGLVEATCTDHGAGATSPLEIAWLRGVERPHGLPRAQRQVRGAVGSRTVFRDIGYEDHALFVELDGRLGHEGAENAFRDMQRDNAAAMDGRTTLRYGWTAVATTPCEVARQVAEALVARGWRGVPTPCCADCSVGSR